MGEDRIRVMGSFLLYPHLIMEQAIINLEVSLAIMIVKTCYLVKVHLSTPEILAPT